MDKYQKYKQRKRAWVNGIKTERGCLDCGIHHPAVLDFHHVSEEDRGQGKNKISTMVGQNRSYDTIAEAIEKCIVLCANCHRLRHWEEKYGSVV